MGQQTEEGVQMPKLRVDRIIGRGRSGTGKIVSAVAGPQAPSSTDPILRIDRQRSLNAVSPLRRRRWAESDRANFVIVLLMLVSLPLVPGTSTKLFAGCVVYLLLYPAVMDGVANRIRRRGRRMVVRSQAARPDQIVDVSPRAQRAIRQAVKLVLLDIVYLNIAVAGAMSLLSGSPVGGSVTLVCAAGGFVLLHWLRRRAGVGHSPARLRRSIGAMVLVLIAVGVAVASFAFFLTAATELTDGNTAVSDRSTAGFVNGLVGLSVSVALLRFARRISMSRALPAILADQRAPILYLRSFADDRLKLRVVPFARPSLLERLSSRRKQGFEEVMAEELQQYGPVSAVGEPGRRLSPIGFVRESLTDADWQGRVRQWMEQSGVIVVTVGRSRGLEWEMQELIHSGFWRKAVFVFPPVGATDLLERWTKLAPLLQDSGLRGIGLPLIHPACSP